MKAEYRGALVRGLPFPLLTVAEYFTQELEGFCWGRRYRLAGYYSCILLWAAFSLWLLMNILLCTVPRYGAYTMQMTGVLMLLTNALYAFLLPQKPLVIPFEGGSLHFAFGWCFWIVLAAGTLCVFVGGAVAIVDLLFPNKFSTILEVDYDMPHKYPMPGTKQNHPQPAQQPVKKEGFENQGFEEEDYSTIIDGKRAVSLRNFGKFAQKEQSYNKRINNFTFDSYRPSKDINIDISAAALW
ncbi:dual oxidase maturation factor 2 [Parasteatoda tepidariorum]|nr:dual oxidase maturation factor 2 [Parasteatoda tepidariorum]